MEEIEKLAKEIKIANPVRKMMLAQEVLPKVVAQLKNQDERLAALEGKKNAARKS